jgi:hypothetical protein
LARSITLRIRSQDCALITGPITVPSSNGSPTVIIWVMASTMATTWS